MNKKIKTITSKKVTIYYKVLEKTKTETIQMNADFNDEKLEAFFKHIGGVFKWWR